MIKQEFRRNAHVVGSDKDRDFYGTPSEWIERCRRVMSGIELDPASCREANEKVVKAVRFFDEKMDALKRSWECSTLFLNPPYSPILTKKFAAKFRNEWESGKIRQAIILVNNTTETGAFDMFSRCATAHAYPRKRIQFIGVEGRSKTQNTRAQTFFYCGPRWKRFRNVFAEANCRILREI
jgi:hypothetical protein